ncbi:hypothetical protein N9L92_02880 [Saprospiraceae bacterium]|nr:hypothetical protein [Saprospiraceae bacterium]
MIFIPKSKIKVILFLLLGSISFCYSQDARKELSESSDDELRKLRFVEVSVDRIFPIQTFRRNVNKNLWNGKLGYLVQLKKEKLDFIGLQLNFSQIDQSSELFFDSEISTVSNFVGLFAMFRHFPDLYFWRIEPFAEVTFGPQFFYTQTTTSFFDVSISNDVRFNEFDTSIAYGVGAGMMLHLTGQIFFTAQANYFGGTSATYFVEGVDLGGFPFDNFNSETSQTSYIKLQFGISVSI